MKLRSHFRRSPSKYGAAVLVFNQFVYRGVFRALSIKLFGYVCAAYRGVRRFPRQCIDDRVPCDSQKPGPKCSPPLVLFPGTNRGGNRDQNPLRQILCIRVLQASPARKSVNHRTIDRRKLYPRVRIGWISHLEQQAVSSFR